MGLQILLVMMALALSATEHFALVPFLVRAGFGAAGLWGLPVASFHSGFLWAVLFGHLWWRRPRWAETLGVMSLY